MLLLFYPAIQSLAEFLLHLKCFLHKLQGLELLLTRCRRTPCFTGIRPQQLITSFMHDGNDYGGGRYWYSYRYWYPIVTSPICVSRPLSMKQSAKIKFAQLKRFSPEHNLPITEKDSLEQATFWHEVKGVCCLLTRLLY